MFNLIKKDIMIQKKSALYSMIIYPLIAIVAFQAYSPEAMFVMGSMSIAYILIVNAFIYDERYQCDIFIKSLPIKRNDIVYSKYWLLFIFSFIGIVIMYAYIFAASLFNININTNGISAVKLASIFFLNILVYGIELPFFFKFGYAKMRMISIIIYVAIVIAIASVSGIAADGGMKSLSAFMSNTPSYLMMVLIVLLIALIVYVSSQISVKIYRNKE